MEGEQLSPEVSQAAHLLAAVVGQDLEKGDDGGFRLARRVAPDLIISTVDPEARHGHKTDARSFDGYKGHVAIDPDGEVITALAADGTRIPQSGAKQLVCTMEAVASPKAIKHKGRRGSGDRPLVAPVRHQPPRPGVTVVDRGTGAGRPGQPPQRVGYPADLDA